MLGSGYVIEHCVSVFKEKKRQEVFNVYLTDCLAGILIGRGAKIKRYYDILHPAKNDNRSPNEIVDNITNRAGIRVVKSHERIEADGDTGD